MESQAADLRQVPKSKRSHRTGDGTPADTEINSHTHTYTLTCVGPGMQDKTLSMFSDVTSTSFTATSTSPEDSVQKGHINKK